MTVRQRFNQFSQMIRRSLRLRLWLLVFLSFLPGILLLIYLIVAKQHEKGLVVIVLAISFFSVVLFRENLRGLKSLSSLLQLSQRLLSGDLTARSSQTDSSVLFGELAQSLDRIAASLEEEKEKLQWHNDVSESFSEVINEFAVQHDITTLLQLIVDKVRKLLVTSHVAIGLYDASRSELEFVAVSGSRVPVGTRIRMGEGAAGRAAENRQLFIVDHYGLWEGRLPECETYAFTTVVQMPIVYRDELIGVLGVAETGATRKFDQAEMRLMKLGAGAAASIIRNARLFNETHRRLQALEAISAVFGVLRVAQNVDEILPLLLEKTMSIVNAIMGSIWLYDTADNFLHEVVSNGIPPRTIRIKPGEQIFGEVFSSAQPYFTFDWREDPLVPNSMRTLIPKGLSGAFIPIRATQSTIGVLHLGFHSPHEFPEDQKHLLTAIAEGAGSAIHRAQLHKQTQRQLQRLSALHQIDLAITGSQDVGNMLQTLLDQVITQLRVDAACVLLVDPNQQTFELAACRGFTTGAARDIHLRFGERYAGRVVLDQGTIYVPDLKARHANYLPSPSFDDEGFVSYLAVPLVAKSKVKGVLEIFHRSLLKPDPEWFDFLEALSSQAAIMIGYASLLDNLQRSNIELNLAYDATLEGWSRALELRDQETKGHSERVAEMILRLAKAMGLSEQDLVHIRRGALLHDVGKLGIPDSILLKPGPLSDEERDILRIHPTIAFEMLAPIAHLRPALDIPQYHHEKWDGSGYPRGLKGEEIPLSARIFAIVDVWDALTSDRPYRKAWSEAKTLAYIREQAGKHFDPRVVEAFFALMNDERTEGSVAGGNSSHASFE